MSVFYQAPLYTSCCWERLLQASAPKMLHRPVPPNCTCDRPSSRRAFSHKQVTRMVGSDWTSSHFASHENWFVGLPCSIITVKGIHKCNHISTFVCPSESAIVRQYFIQTKQNKQCPCLQSWAKNSVFFTWSRNTININTLDSLLDVDVQVLFLLRLKKLKVPGQKQRSIPQSRWNGGYWTKTNHKHS